MAMKMVIKLDTVDGESNLKGFDGYIDIDSYSLDFHQSGSFHRGGGGGGGGVAVGDLMLTKKLDKSSADLMRKVCLGKHYSNVELEVLKNTGEGLVQYYKITLTDAIVSSYNVGGSADGADAIQESFSLNFRKIATEYHMQGADGVLAPGGDMEFNVATGEGG